MVRSKRGQAVWDEVVVRVARPDLDHFALLAEALDRMDQEQLDAALRTFRQGTERKDTRALELLGFCRHGISSKADSPQRTRRSQRNLCKLYAFLGALCVLCGELRIVYFRTECRRSAGERRRWNTVRTRRRSPRPRHHCYCC